MAESLGKKFEAAFKADWKRCFPNSFIYRLPDQMSGFAGGGSSNPCDFIGFAKGKLFMIECKEHKGASLPFSAIRQYDKLISFIGLDEVYPGVLVWLSEKDLVFWVPAEELKKMKEAGLKSVGIKALNEKLYNIIQIPSVKKRTFMASDYNILLRLNMEDKILEEAVEQIKKDYQERFAPRNLGNGLMLKYVKNDDGSISAQVVKED